jgi:hypothetical protein
MNMVLHSAHTKRLHLALARDAAHVGPQLWLDFSDDALAPFLGGKNAMKERTAIGV